MENKLDKAKKEEWEPKIIAFLCNWCSYAGADLAGVSRLQYPPNIRIIRVPCSGRVNPYFIIKSLQRGWDWGFSFRMPPRRLPLYFWESCS